MLRKRRESFLKSVRTSQVNAGCFKLLTHPKEFTFSQPVLSQTATFVLLVKTVRSAFSLLRWYQEFALYSISVLILYMNLKRVHQVSFGWRTTTAGTQTVCFAIQPISARPAKADSKLCWGSASQTPTTTVARPVRTVYSARGSEPSSAALYVR